MRLPGPARRAGTTTPVEIAIALGPLVAGGLVGIVTAGGGSRWYRRLAKPAWTPPPAAFGPVWSVLYLLMGIAATLVARAAGRGAPGARPALAAFGVQLVLNLAWSLLFFGARRVRLAGAELALLWVAIVVTTVAFVRVRVVAGLLLLPYLAWTTFAGVLNADLVRRNPGQ